jgi:hypothetical protein
MKMHFSLLAVAVLLGSAQLAEAFPYARAAMAARTVRANVDRGFGYGYGVGVGYAYGYDNNYYNTPETITPSYTLSGTLSQLPAGAAPVVIFGKTYYFANGNYYLPQTVSGKNVFVVANP